MKVGDKVVVTDKEYDKYLNGAVGTIVGEQICNSHFWMLNPSQYWVVNFEGLGSTTFRESDLRLAN